MAKVIATVIATVIAKVVAKVIGSKRAPVLTCPLAHEVPTFLLFLVCGRSATLGYYLPQTRLQPEYSSARWLGVCHACGAGLG